MTNHPNRRRTTKEKVAVSPSIDHDHEHDYSALLNGVRASFEAATADTSVLFATDVKNLNFVYLDALPSERQVHNCAACRRFIETYGGLVTISEDGTTEPVMWCPDGVPAFYHQAFSAMQASVRRARITSVFYSKRATWGTPMTGKWSHISVAPPTALIFRERVMTPGQAMAAAKENLRTVATALTESTTPMLDEALRLLRADALARSERFVGPVQWLRTLQDRPKGRIGENVLWRAIATAPEGYCHPRASVIGPLLEDIKAGLPFVEIKARFDAKMAPLQYQRPQAAPTAGNIKAAEALVEKMGIAPALERRFARLDELQIMWRPAAARSSPPASGVFGHLKAKNTDAVQSVDLPAVTMTWDKFTRTVLPGAEQIKLYVPGRGRFIALTTAVHGDAPSILKWDQDNARNPVAWYVYPNGSYAASWGLTAGTWATVNALTPLPNLWGARPMPFLSDGVVLVIDGAVDTMAAGNAGNALFPECLKEEMHAVRATIEAYSRGATLHGRDQASACGYDLRKAAADCTLRVLAGVAWSGYKIDRWD